VRECAEKFSKQLPRDSAPNRSLLKAVVAINTFHAIKKRSTMFVTDLLHHKEQLLVKELLSPELFGVADRQNIEYGSNA
jgi:hypothetical protein